MVVAAAVWDSALARPAWRVGAHEAAGIGVRFAAMLQSLGVSSSRVHDAQTAHTAVAA